MNGVDVYIARLNITDGILLLGLLFAILGHIIWLWLPIERRSPGEQWWYIVARWLMAIGWMIFAVAVATLLLHAPPNPTPIEHSGFDWRGFLGIKLITQ